MDYISTSKRVSTVYDTGQGTIPPEQAGGPVSPRSSWLWCRLMRQTASLAQEKTRLAPMIGVGMMTNSAASFGRNAGRMSMPPVAQAMVRSVAPATSIAMFLDGMPGIHGFPANRDTNETRVVEGNRELSDMQKSEHDERAGSGAFVNVRDEVCRYPASCHLLIRHLLVVESIDEYLTTFALSNIPQTRIQKGSFLFPAASSCYCSTNSSLSVAKPNSAARFTNRSLSSLLTVGVRERNQRYERLLLVTNAY